MNNNEMNITTLHDSVPKKTITIDNISTYELCRWAALKEAVDIIGDKCDEKGMELTSEMLQPLQILNYVERVSDTLYNQVLQNEEN